EMADHRITDEGKIADGVEDLVADEFVFEPQRVQHARFTEDDGVLERTTQRQTVLTQHLDVLQERERTGRRQVVHKRFLGDRESPRLLPEKRMVEADAVGDLEMV